MLKIDLFEDLVWPSNDTSWSISTFEIGFKDWVLTVVGRLIVDGSVDIGCQSWSLQNHQLELIWMGASLGHLLWKSLWNHIVDPWWHLHWACTLGSHVLTFIDKILSLLHLFHLREEDWRCIFTFLISDTIGKYRNIVDLCGSAFE